MKNQSSLLFDTDPRGPKILRTLCGSVLHHMFELTSLTGLPGEDGAREMFRCRLCHKRRITVNHPGLSDSELRETAEEEFRASRAITWLLDNVEPTYAVGRGCENGKVVDRDEPWAVPRSDTCG